MVLRSLLSLALLGLAAQDSRDSSSADVDGPYIYEAAGGTWISKRVVRKNGNLVAAVETLEAAEFEMPLPGRSLKVRIRPPGDRPVDSIPAPDRLLAVSDVEGNLGGLVDVLLSATVIDDAMRWTFGKGHLVVLGDVFDRGLNVTECLWLLYELEGRARAAGGDIHLILGNHEVMNLTGDLRYVRNKYRENAALLGEKLEELYASRTLLGRWLRSRNAIMKIGDEIFVHGGISPSVAESKVSIATLNDALRTALAADAWPKAKEGHLKMVVDGKEGLTWYRGYVKDPIDAEKMDAILAAFDAKRVVVGHTVVDKIGFTLGGRVLTLDVRHAKGAIQAAIREGGTWSRLRPDGRREKLD